MIPPYSYDETWCRFQPPPTPLPPSGLLSSALFSFPIQPPNGRAKLAPASRQRQFPHEQWRKNFPVRRTFHRLRLSVFLSPLPFFLFSSFLLFPSLVRQLFVEGTPPGLFGRVGIPGRRKIADDEHITGRSETVVDKLQEITENDTESSIDRLMSNARGRERGKMRENIGDGGWCCDCIY